MSGVFYQISGIFDMEDVKKAIELNNKSAFFIVTFDRAVEHVDIITQCEFEPERLKDISGNMMSWNKPIDEIPGDKLPF